MDVFPLSKALFYSSQERSVFLLRLAYRFRRATGPTILILSLDEELVLLDEASQQEIRTKSILVPAGSGFDFVTNRAHVAMCFLNDLGTDLRYLIPHMSQSILTQGGQTFYHGVKFESQMIENARDVWLNEPPARFTLGKLAQWVRTFEFLAHQGGMSVEVDERVALAISLIKRTCTQNLSVEMIAREVGLSVPRLSQLFKETTSTSIRSFRLWQRVFYAARSLQSGLSLTEAAVSAGFTDYAQCFRVYRDLGGYHPGKTKGQTAIKAA